MVQVDQVRQATVSHTRDEMMNRSMRSLFSKRIVVGVGTQKLIHSDVASVLEHWVNCGERFRLFAKIVEEWPGKRIFVAPLEGQQGGWIADRRGTQNKPADHGEDGAVGADIPADLK